MNPRVIIWFAIVMSTVIYLVLGITFSGDASQYHLLGRDQYVPVLHGVALVMFVIGWYVVPRVIRSNDQMRMIVSLAVFESCAIFGLLGAFLTKDWRIYLFPWALALIGFIRVFPRASAAEPPAPL